MIFQIAVRHKTPRNSLNRRKILTLGGINIWNLLL
nr:MAG TPA: hypothetical protein [Caudoviricetes sp.]